MHLLAAQPGGFTDNEGIVDLGQSAGDLVLLSAADGMLASLAVTVETLPEDYPQVRLANWMQLLKPAAFDLYQDKVLDKTLVVVVSLLGGSSYWKYGFERLVEWADQVEGRRLILVPGDDSADPELFDACTVPRDDAMRVWRYLREGGHGNHQQLFNFLAQAYLGGEQSWRDPQPLPHCLLYRPGSVQADPQATYEEWEQRWQKTNPNAAVALLLFYRSHLQTENTPMFDQLIDALEVRGIIHYPSQLRRSKIRNH